MQNDKTFELSELENMVDDVQASEVESSDYLNFDLIPVGNYLSESRSISKVTEKKDPSTGRTYLSFTIELTGGIVDPATGTVYGRGSFPIKTWISTKPFSKDNRPGQTSGVADYLRATGIDPKGDGSLQEKLELSLTLPAMVFIGWQDRQEKQADGSYLSANGSKKSVLKTKDFNVGTKENPQYSPSVTVDGVTYRAQHKVASFSKVKSN